MCAETMEEQETCRWKNGKMGHSDTARQPATETSWKEVQERL